MPARPRLIVLASTYPRWQGDYEPSFVHALARRLTDHFDVIAVVPHAKGSLRTEVLDGVSVVRYRYGPERMETLVNDGGIVTNLRRSPWKWVLVPSFIAMQWWEARRYVNVGSVVHAHWLIPQGAIARFLGAPYAITCHGADVFALKGRIARLAKRFASAKASIVAIVSVAMRLPLAPLDIPPLKILVRPMGVDLTGTFTPEASIPRDSGHLVFVGRFVEKKGVDTLLRAMAIALLKNPSLRLSLIGHGPLEASLRRLCTGLGLDHAVSFIGPLSQDSLVQWYRKACLFVAPFRQASSGDVEGLGLVMVEALGCGCPVLASDVPAVRDVLDGVPGVETVVPGDPSALATALVRMTSDEATLWHEAAAAARIMRERFDWATVADGYAKMLLSIRGGGP